MKKKRSVAEEKKKKEENTPNVFDLCLGLKETVKRLEKEWNLRERER